jgi:diacylglycerol kinase
MKEYYQGFIAHFARSFRDAFHGLVIVWQEERNFRVQCVAALVVLISLLLIGFTYIETALLVVAVILVLSAEVTNTAFEDTLNKIQPNEDPVVGRIKDVAAGVVVIHVIGACTIGFLVFTNHFYL